MDKIVANTDVFKLKNSVYEPSYEMNSHVPFCDLRPCLHRVSPSLLSFIVYLLSFVNKK